MSLTPSNVPWDANRYKAVEYVIKYDANGIPALEKKEASYTNTNYNFAALPPKNPITIGPVVPLPGITPIDGPQELQPITAQTDRAFGDVIPDYGKGNLDNTTSWRSWNVEPPGKSDQAYSKSIYKKPSQELVDAEDAGTDWKRTPGTMPKRPISGVWGPQERFQLKKLQKKKEIKPEYENIVEESKFNIDKEHQQKMKIFNLNKELSEGGLDLEEEAALRKQLDELGSYDTKTGKYNLKEKEGLLSKLPIPIIGTAMKIGKVLSKVFPDSPTQKLNKRLFKIRGGNRDAQRIVGNPAEDLFAGMNRTSAFGSLEKSGQKRLDRRNKTIAKGKASQEFINNTKNMEREHSTYVQEKRKEINKKKDTIGMPHNITSGGEDQGGRDSGKIVCTMMNESYGFGSFRNKIWMKFHKDIAPEYQKGYHKLFLPLVSYAKQKGNINKIIKKTLEHIARHSTLDMRQSLRGKKHLLGRVYRKILLPLCYWIGKK